MIGTKKIKFLLIIALSIILSSCSSVSNVSVNKSFPDVLFSPKELKVAIIFTDEFSQFVGKPNDKTTIDLGLSQVNLFKSAFKGLFSEVYFIENTDLASENTDLIISLSNSDVQVATPSENYLNVFEVWIKYNLVIQDPDGRTISNWFMPAYGKTPSAFLYSKENAISQAANVALRDAGAKLLLDFYRIPAINQWVKKRKQNENQNYWGCLLYTSPSPRDKRQYRMPSSA